MIKKIFIALIGFFLIVVFYFAYAVLINPKSPKGNASIIEKDLTITGIANFNADINIPTNKIKIGENILDTTGITANKITINNELLFENNTLIKSNEQLDCSYLLYK